MTTKEKIHDEYLNTDISIRGLASKYNIPKGRIESWIKSGNWSTEKKALLSMAERIAVDKRADSNRRYVDIMAERVDRIYSASDKLLDKVTQLLELEDALAPRDLKSISSTLLDIKMLHGIRDADEDKEDKTLTVTFVKNPWDVEGEK